MANNEFHMIRSPLNPDLYLLTRDERMADGAMIQSDIFSLDWRQLEMLNREIVALRAQDTLAAGRADEAQA